MDRSERAPWGDFPAVIRNGELNSVGKDIDYASAKGGDPAAAVRLVNRLVTAELIAQLREAIGDRQPKVVPVIAPEASGINMIPLAYASAIASHLNLEVEVGIGQKHRVHRTNSGSDYRLVANPVFKGDVTAGQDYLVVDDTLTMGGTVAALRGYLENRGGNVMLISVMTAHPGALELPVKQKMLAAIDARHGSAMNQMWQERFGYGIDMLTQGEAGHLRHAESVDAMRVRLDDAFRAYSERLHAPRVSEAPGAAEAAARRGSLKSVFDQLHDRVAGLSAPGEGQDPLAGPANQNRGPRP